MVPTGATQDIQADERNCTFAVRFLTPLHQTDAILSKVLNRSDNIIYRLHLAYSTLLPRMRLQLGSPCAQTHYALLARTLAMKDIARVELQVTV